MTRKKVTLAFITNESERKASYKKRKKGLIKKVSEISVLCDVDACAIIYGPYSGLDSPEVWPSPERATAVVERFRRLSEMEQGKKMLNQDSFTRQRIRKLEENLRRVRKENKRTELEIFMFRFMAGIVGFEGFDVADAAEMGWVVKQLLREVSFRIQDLKMGAGSGDAPARGEELRQAPAGDGFQWGLWESSGEASGTGSGGGSGLYWDDVMVTPAAPPFSYFLDGGAPAEPGNGSK